MTLPLAFAASFGGLAFYFGGAGGAAYAVLYALTLLPGLRLGWRLAGRSSPLGWVAGGLLGYALSAIAFWVPAWCGWSHPLAFIAAWLALTVGVRRLVPAGAEPLLALPAWSAQATRHYLAFLIIVAAFVALPFARVGEAEADGTRLYRSYFTADFVWHMALTEELARFEFPLTNPYLAPDPIHYYWTYFMVPAALAGRESSRLVTVEAALKITAVGTAVLMFSLIFLSAWAVTGSSLTALWASLLALLAPSWEGIYAIADFLSRGYTIGAVFDEVRQINIDAVTNWKFRGLRMDGLVRSAWWTPQHVTSFSLGLLATLAAAVGGQGVSAARVGCVGLILALSVTMNPFLGAAFSLAYGIIVLAYLPKTPRPIRALLLQAWAMAPVAAGLVWTVLNRMGGDAGSDLAFGWRGLSRNAPLATLVLSLGGLLVPALVALAFIRDDASQRAARALPVVGVGLGLAWSVSLVSEPAWVGFRTANLLQASLPMLVAAGLTALLIRSRVTAIALFTSLLVVGAPTTLIDTFNAQDLENRAMGPGFHWVIPISPAQQAGFAWLRANTPPRAVVQADPIVRGREDWSLIPSFAGRRMAAGEPISLILTPEYKARTVRVHDLMTVLDPVSAHAEARRLGIEYLWVDEDDPRGAVDRLQARPDLFALRFRRGAVRILAVEAKADAS